MEAHPLTAHFTMLARYNAQANEILYAACAELSDAERKRDRRAFFRSIHGTLNHILVGDRIWMARFTGEQPPPVALDAILYEDFQPLHTARRAEDAQILRYVAALTPEEVAGRLRYVNREGVSANDPLAILLAQFFNHQTHHRGQVHDMLSQTDVPPPSLDLHRVLRAAPDGARWA